MSACVLVVERCPLSPVIGSTLQRINAVCGYWWPICSAQSDPVAVANWGQRPEGDCRYLTHETVLFTCTASIVIPPMILSAGDLVRYLPILVALLPVALQCVRDSNAEVAAMGRGACLSGAAALSARSHKDKYIGLSTSDNPAGRNASPESDTLGGGIAAVLSAAKSQASWRVRRNAVAVACVLQTRLHFVLTAAQHKDIDATLLSLLGDERREVQETARLALSTRVAHLTAAKARALCEQFSAGADSAAASRKKRRKLARRQVAGASTAINKAKEPTGAMKEQQTNVLGLSAVVLAAPCDVPPWVPEALESLARHANDESPGRLPVRQTVRRGRSVCFR